MIQVESSHVLMQCGRVQVNLHTTMQRSASVPIHIMIAISLCQMCGYLLVEKKFVSTGSISVTAPVLLSLADVECAGVFNLSWPTLMHIIW